MNDPSHSWKFWVFRSLIIFTIAMGVTLQCVSVSKQMGRLANVPNYDDCTYMLSASLLDAKWKQGDLLGAFHTLKHSPYSVGLAAAAFAILGNQDSAPYHANIVVVVAYLAALTWLLRGVPFFPWLVSLLILVNLPIVKMGVVEFRPDIFWAVCTGFGAIYVLVSPELLKNRGEALFSGLIFTAAYLAKPTTFALTTIVLFASFGGRFMHAWFFQHVQKINLSDIWRSTAIVGSALVILAGWYYVCFGDYIWHYFYDNSFGVNQSIWSFKGNWIDSITYYLKGSAAKSSMGTLGALIFLLTVALSNWKLATASAMEITRFVLLCGICFLIYAINTLGMKSQFLGASMYMLIIFIGADLLNCFYLRYRDVLRAKQAMTGSLVVLAFATALFFREWPPYSDWSEKSGKAAPYFREATLDFVKVLRSMNPRPKTILFTQSGPVIPETVGIQMLRHRENLINYQSASFVHTIDDFRQMQKTADMIVVPAMDTNGMTRHLPIQMIIPDILKDLASDPEFHLYQTIFLTEGGSIYIYVRPAPTSAPFVGSRSGFISSFPSPLVLR